MIVDGTVVDNFEYDYNLNGRLTDEIDLDSTGRDVSYELDDLDRVVEYSGPAGDTAYNLDEVNNIRQKYDPATTPTAPEETTDFGISTNNLNQIVSLTLPGSGYSRVFDYDDAGRMTLDTLDEGVDDDRTYSWDNHSRLVEVSREDVGTIASYAYDALGRRVRKVVEGDEGEVVDFLLYGDDVMEEHHTPMGMEDPWMLAVLHDPTATDRYLRWDRYTLTSGGAVAEGSLAPVIDIRNNVSAVVDGDGNLEPLVYDLHGNEMGPDHGDLYIPYRFAGRRLDEETGLYCNRTRYYSSELGRFISVDSIGIWGDLNNYGNGYVYAGNMGNIFSDPMGLHPENVVNTSEESKRKMVELIVELFSDNKETVRKTATKQGTKRLVAMYIGVRTAGWCTQGLWLAGDSEPEDMGYTGECKCERPLLIKLLLLVLSASEETEEEEEEETEEAPVAEEEETEEEEEEEAAESPSPSSSTPSPDDNGDFDPSNFKDKAKRDRSGGDSRNVQRSTMLPGVEGVVDDYNPWEDPDGNTRIGSGYGRAGGRGPSPDATLERMYYPVSVPDDRALQQMNLKLRQLNRSIGGGNGDPWDYCGTLPFRGLGSGNGGASPSGNIEG